MLKQQAAAKKKVDSEVKRAKSDTEKVRKAAAKLVAEEAKLENS